MNAFGTIGLVVVGGKMAVKLLLISDVFATCVATLRQVWRSENVKKSMI